MTTTGAPLTGWRVLVPRGGRWGDEVGAALRSRGAAPVIAPMINFASPEDTHVLLDALRQLQAGEFNWLAVTSATAVDVLVSQHVSIPRSTHIAAVGEATSAVLRAAGYRVDFVPVDDHSAHGLVNQWPATSRGERVLIPQSDIAAPTLASGLSDLGLHVEAIAAYRTVGIPVSEDIVADVLAGSIHALLVTSGSVARAMRDQFGPLPKKTIVACIGPYTAADARASGIRVDIVARERSAHGLVESLAEHVQQLHSTFRIEGEHHS